MTVPLSDARLTAIRERFEQTTHPDWRDTTDMGALLAEVDRLRGELDSLDSTPLVARWDRRVVHPQQPDDPDGTLVECIADDGRPVALFLDDEHREALGLALLLPDGDGEVDLQHLELARENEQLRAQVADLERAVTYFDEQSKRRKTERDQARAQVHAASTVKCWVNEDGRRFVFAEDLAFALGYTPTDTAPTT